MGLKKLITVIGDGVNPDIGSREVDRIADARVEQEGVAGGYLIVEDESDCLEVLLDRARGIYLHYGCARAGVAGAVKEEPVRGFRDLEDPGRGRFEIEKGRDGKAHVVDAVGELLGVRGVRRIWE